MSVTEADVADNEPEGFSLPEAVVRGKEPHPTRGHLVSQNMRDLDQKRSINNPVDVGLLTILDGFYCTYSQLTKPLKGFLRFFRKNHYLHICY